MNTQTSIAESVRIDGVNIYNGRRNYATFHPAEEDTEFRFHITGHRFDLFALRKLFESGVFVED